MSELDPSQMKQKKRIGRPYKGEVEDGTLEPFVPERRSIFRGLKKYYGKSHFKVKAGKDSSEAINQICDGLPEADKNTIVYYINQCKST